MSSASTVAGQGGNYWCSFNGSWTKVILVLFVAGQRCSGADSTVPGQKEKTELTQLSGLFCKIRVWAPFNIFKYERLFIFFLVKSVKEKKTVL
jgi:hypothetical protein